MGYFQASLLMNDLGDYDRAIELGRMAHDLAGSAHERQHREPRGGARGVVAGECARIGGRDDRADVAAAHGERPLDERPAYPS